MWALQGNEWLPGAFTYLHITGHMDAKYKQWNLGDKSRIPLCQNYGKLNIKKHLSICFFTLTTSLQYQEI